jgi:plasmid stabilization system protein ParE
MAGNDAPSPATFLLTRNAALDLRRIHTRSRRECGDDVADQYLVDLYAAIGVTAANPEKGRLRQYRSTPFLMVPARQHFVIYNLVPQGIAVLTVQHQVRDIETLIAELTPAFHAEVERLKRKAWSHPLTPAALPFE